MSLATQLVHWPGKDTLMCDKHAEKARVIAQAMGFALSRALWLGEPEECKNCENEAPQHAHRGTGE